MSAQVTQVVKAKSAAAKKSATKAAPKAAAKPATKQITHIIQDYARPIAGRRLFAFTAAWLELTGLHKGETVAQDKLEKIAGKTAVSYHRKQGNFEMQKTGVALSAKGHNFFGKRKMDNEYDEATKEVFADIMTSGKADGQQVKDAKAIVKLEAVK